MNLDVLYQFNENYAPYAGVSMTSLLTSHPQEKIRIFILGEDLLPDSIARFEKMAASYGCEVRFISTRLLIEEMKRMGIPLYRGSYAASMRLLWLICLMTAWTVCSIWMPIPLYPSTSQNFFSLT